MSGFEWPITELTDEQVRKLIKMADKAGYPQRDRKLILPAPRVLIGEVYGIQVYRGSLDDQQPYLECPTKRVMKIGLHDELYFAD